MPRERFTMNRVEEMDELVIRSEDQADHAAIHRITQAAFAASPFGHHGEAALIDRLRRSCPEIVSLVADQGGELVGHILFSPVELQGTIATCAGMGLGPMAVATDCQRRGVGTALVNAGLERLEREGCSFVVVLGDPGFYGRCGFRAAADLGIGCEFAGIPVEAFQIALLKGAKDGLPAGTIRYRAEFLAFE